MIKLPVEMPETANILHHARALPGQMKWDALPEEIISHIFEARRLAMARELCARMKDLRDVEQRIWPLGVSPNHIGRAKAHAIILRWCDKCDHHAWIEQWIAAAQLLCKVCRRECIGVYVCHPGHYCSDECYTFH